MDELELLKKDWNKQPENNRLTVKDIYPMLHKKSSSIVKTLFYISIAELLFWILINVVSYSTSDTFKNNIDILFSESMFTALSIFSYAVIVLFVYLLYKSYKSISVTDNAKKLMQSIMNTRKIIKYYVLYNLIMVFLSSVAGLTYSINNTPELATNFSHFNNKQMAVFIIFTTIVLGVSVVLIWLFYKLIYGWLLKRLNKNYKELEKLEV